MQLPTSFFVSAVALGLAGVTEGICSGQTYGIGTAKAIGANTQC